MKSRIGAIAIAGVLAAACDPAPLVIPFQDKPMQRLANNIYAEPGVTDADARTLLAAHTTAAANVKDFFGAPRSGLPVAIFCGTAVCKVLFGAPPAAAASLDLGFSRDALVTKDGLIDTPVVVATGPVFNTARILTHELVHAEMKSWVAYDALPTWFNEGMATWIANEPDCGSRPPVSRFDVRQLDTKEKWQAHIRTPGVTIRTYCEAREAASQWAGQFPNHAAAGAATRLLLQVRIPRNPITHSA